MKDVELIAELTRDLRPGPRLLPLMAIAALWLAAAVAWVLGVGLALGPLRPDVADALLSRPLYLLEKVIGAAAALAFGWLAVSSAVPGRATRRLGSISGALLGAWLLFFLLGDWLVVLEPSMVGKRDHCALEAYLLSLPPLALLILLQRRRYPLSPVSATVIAAVAAALLPALFMQIGCMYEVEHILLHHVGPVFIIAVGAALVALVVERRRAQSRSAS